MKCQHCGYDGQGVDMAHQCPGFQRTGRVILTEIDPFTWAYCANERRPKSPETTEWFNGMYAPVHIGWYERHFTDSMIIEAAASMQWWDGKLWRDRPDGIPHWRQVGSYPAWRGLAEKPAA